MKGNQITLREARRTISRIIASGDTATIAKPCCERGPRRIQTGQGETPQGLDRRPGVAPRTSAVYTPAIDKRPRACTRQRDPPAGHRRFAPRRASPPGRGPRQNHPCHSTARIIRGARARPARRQRPRSPSPPPDSPATRSRFPLRPGTRALPLASRVASRRARRAPGKKPNLAPRRVAGRAEKPNHPDAAFGAPSRRVREHAPRRRSAASAVAPLSGAPRPRQPGKPSHPLSASQSPTVAPVSLPTAGGRLRPPDPHQNKVLVGRTSRATERHRGPRRAPPRSPARPQGSVGGQVTAGLGGPRESARVVVVQRSVKAPPHGGFPRAALLLLSAARGMPGSSASPLLRRSRSKTRASIPRCRRRPPAGAGYTKPPGRNSPAGGGGCFVRAETKPKRQPASVAEKHATLSQSMTALRVEIRSSRARDGAAPENGSGANLASESSRARHGAAPANGSGANLASECPSASDPPKHPRRKPPAKNATPGKTRRA